MTDALTVEIKKVAEGGNPTVALGLLHEMDRNDIKAKAAIRYLFNVGKWSLEEGSKFAEVLEHHFAKNDGMVEMEPQIYQKVTGEIIKDLWDHEIQVVVIQPAPKAENPKPVRTAKKTRKSVSTDSEGESGSRTFKSLKQHDIDTTGASDRLKKVINIQRNG